MQLNNDEFKKQLMRYINFRGIDIVLHLKSGEVVELDKNRQIEGDHVIKSRRGGSDDSVHLDEILKAEFFAA